MKLSLMSLNTTSPKFNLMLINTSHISSGLSDVPYSGQVMFLVRLQPMLWFNLMRKSYFSATSFCLFLRKSNKIHAIFSLGFFMPVYSFVCLFILLYASSIWFALGLTCLKCTLHVSADSFLQFEI